ncbi:hypothetical protein DMB92_05365 [Campylobacter sp. MIT 99-7217]|uniref:tyrosine-type recombinase/integrase n=1 Tax=Campylobacter sp. MIT 99-7217 TaxID=535091 RepID=UPI0011571003|nr:site-specific integrase [Campylobacter sp. MIT 99-7217]TQR31818.1 hypothetical protein DMB92_05365 [Campylobacter sp. MIT 99-7217]
MTTNIYARGRKLYLDYRDEGQRFRIASGLKDSPEARTFISDNYLLFIEDKQKANLAFREFSDKKTERALKATEARYENKKREFKGELKELFELFEKSLLSNRTNTLKSYASMKAFVYDFLAHCKIRKIQDLNNQLGFFFVGFAKEKKNCNTTLKIRANFFNRFLSFLVENEYLLKNPFKLPKLSYDEAEASKKNEKAFDYEEMKLLIMNAKGDLKDYLQIAFFTGARTGEILGLKKSDIDFAKNELHIKRTRLENGGFNLPKTKASFRTIDLLPIVKNALLKRLEELKKDDELIFKKYRAFKLRHDFKALLERLGFDKKIPIYNTRHSFASLMISKNEDIEWVSKRMLGHTNTAMTFQKYSKYLKKDIAMRANFINEEDF